jgi:cbb3-type cytochrome oxidase cytochrome c subunit
LERFGFILITAGILSFIFAFIVMGALPIAMYAEEPIAEVSDLAKEIPYEFYMLAETDFPEQFEKHFGEANSETFGEALALGHKAYVAEACWHCHSQYIRPVSNEDIRWGRVSYPGEYNNRLQMPVLFGTRRVGPDLIRSNGRHGNDWHAAHFFRPKNVVPDSVMPEYPWFFDEEGMPNKKGLALITYVQWLGSWEQKAIRADAAKAAGVATAAAATEAK